MSFLTIDREKCNQDGICVDECPTRIIALDSGDGYPEPIQDADKYCLACGHCVTVCPKDALSLNWLDPDACPPVKKEMIFSPEQAEQFIRSRRSIRTFRDKAVERDKLEKLIEIACYAPSAKNMQPWHWIVIEDSKEVRRLAGMVIKWMRGVIEKNRELAEDVGFTRVVKSWENGDERICRGAPHVIVVHGDKNWAFGVEDCTLALSYLDLYASNLGLGTCWGGYFYSAANQYKPLFKELGVPDDHRVYGAMMVGYRKYHYHRLPKRKPPVVIWK